MQGCLSITIGSK